MFVTTTRLLLRTCTKTGQEEAELTLSAGTDTWRLVSLILSSAIIIAVTVGIFRDINGGRRKTTKLVILTRLAVFLSSTFSCHVYSSSRWSSGKHDIICKAYVVQPKGCTIFGGLSNLWFNLQDHIFSLFLFGSITNSTLFVYKYTSHSLLCKVCRASRSSLAITQQVLCGAAA